MVRANYVGMTRAIFGIAFVLSMLAMHLVSFMTLTIGDTSVSESWLNELRLGVYISGSVALLAVLGWWRETVRLR